MNTSWQPEDLAAVPTLGWVRDPSPVLACPELAQGVGLATLHVKCDDRIPSLGGGNKVRKLDYLLAQPHFAAAHGWQSVGAVGSGHLVAMAQAARLQGKELIAHCFPQPLSPSVRENLALIASGPTTFHYHRSRLILGLRHPGLVLGTDGAPQSPRRRAPSGQRAIARVAPGASAGVGLLGYVRAGLELGAQVRAGVLPEPDFVLLTWGSGGTVAGLSVGLALAGVSCTLWAVSAVERIFARRARLRSLQREIVSVLRSFGIALPERWVPRPVHFDMTQIGPGYGIPTPESLAACALSEQLHVAIEPIYTGKTLAVLQQRRSEAFPGCRVLYWHTARGKTLQPQTDWHNRLPPAMGRLLAMPPASPVSPVSPVDRRRRHLLQAGVLTAAAGALGAHRACGGYVAWPHFVGECLSDREAQILIAAATAILPASFSMADGARADSGPTEASIALRVARHVDRYVAGLPSAMQNEVHLLLSFVEQATPLGLRLRRLSRLSLAGRHAYVESLAGYGGLLFQAYRGVRDLCLLGFYSLPEAWSSIGYPGPWVAAGRPARAQTDFEQRYRALRAAAGRMPTARVGEPEGGGT